MEREGPGEMGDDDGRAGARVTAPVELLEFLERDKSVVPPRREARTVGARAAVLRSIAEQLYGTSGRLLLRLTRQPSAGVHCFLASFTATAGVGTGGGTGEGGLTRRTGQSVGSPQNSASVLLIGPPEALNGRVNDFNVLSEGLMHRADDHGALKRLVGPGPGRPARGDERGTWAGVAAPLREGIWSSPPFASCPLSLSVSPLSSAYMRMLSGDPRHCAPYAHAALAAGSIARAVERLRVLHPEFRPIERSGHLRQLAALLAQCVRTYDAVLRDLMLTDRPSAMRLLAMNDGAEARPMQTSANAASSRHGGRASSAVVRQGERFEVRLQPPGGLIRQPCLAHGETWRDVPAHAERRLKVLMAQARQAQLVLKNALLRYAKPVSEADMEAAWPTGTTKGGLLLAHWGGGEAYDPGVKAEAAVHAKAERRADGDVSLVTDVARLRISYEGCDGLLRGLSALQADGSGVEVIGVRNRFRQPTCLGWRDMTVLVSVALPADGSGGGGGGGLVDATLPEATRHVCEVQLHLRSYEAASAVVERVVDALRERIASLCGASDVDTRVEDAEDAATYQEGKRRNEDEEERQLRREHELKARRLVRREKRIQHRRRQLFATLRPELEDAAAAPSEVLVARNHAALRDTLARVLGDLWATATCKPRGTPKQLAEEMGTTEAGGGWCIRSDLDAPAAGGGSNEGGGGGTVFGPGPSRPSDARTNDPGRLAKRRQEEAVELDRVAMVLEQAAEANPAIGVVISSCLQKLGVSGGAGSSALTPLSGANIRAAASAVLEAFELNDGDCWADHAAGNPILLGRCNPALRLSDLLLDLSGGAWSAVLDGDTARPRHASFAISVLEIALTHGALVPAGQADLLECVRLTDALADLDFGGCDECATPRYLRAPAHLSSHAARQAYSAAAMARQYAWAYAGPRARASGLALDLLNLQHASLLAHRHLAPSPRGLIMRRARHATAWCFYAMCVGYDRATGPCRADGMEQLLTSACLSSRHGGGDAAAAIYSSSLAPSSSTPSGLSLVSEYLEAMQRRVDLRPDALSGDRPCDAPQYVLPASSSSARAGEEEAVPAAAHGQLRLPDTTVVVDSGHGAIEPLCEVEYAEAASHFCGAVRAELREVAGVCSLDGELGCGPPSEAREELTEVMELPIALRPLAMDGRGGRPLARGSEVHEWLCAQLEELEGAMNDAKGGAEAGAEVASSAARPTTTIVAVQGSGTNDRRTRKYLRTEQRRLNSYLCRKVAYLAASLQRLDGARLVPLLVSAAELEAARTRMLQANADANLHSAPSLGGLLRAHLRERFGAAGRGRMAVSAAWHRGGRLLLIVDDLLASHGDLASLLCDDGDSPAKGGAGGGRASGAALMLVTHADGEALPPALDTRAARYQVVHGGVPIFAPAEGLGASCPRQPLEFLPALRSIRCELRVHAVFNERHVPCTSFFLRIRKRFADRRHVEWTELQIDASTVRTSGSRPRRVVLASALGGGSEEAADVNEEEIEKEPARAQAEPTEAEAPDAAEESVEEAKAPEATTADATADATSAKADADKDMGTTEAEAAEDASEGDLLLTVPYTFEGLEQNTEYEVGVNGTNAIGVGQWSDSQTCRTSSLPTPLGPCGPIELLLSEQFRPPRKHFVALEELELPKKPKNPDEPQPEPPCFFAKPKPVPKAPQPDPAAPSSSSAAAADGSSAPAPTARAVASLSTASGTDHMSHEGHHASASISSVEQGYQGVLPFGADNILMNMAKWGEPSAADRRPPPTAAETAPNGVVTISGGGAYHGSVCEHCVRHTMKPALLGKVPTFAQAAAAEADPDPCLLVTLPVGCLLEEIHLIDGYPEMSGSPRLPSRLSQLHIQVYHIDQGARLTLSCLPSPSLLIARTRESQR